MPNSTSLRAAAVRASLAFASLSGGAAFLPVAAPALAATTAVATTAASPTTVAPTTTASTAASTAAARASARDRAAARRAARLERRRAARQHHRDVLRHRRQVREHRRQVRERRRRHHLEVQRRREQHRRQLRGAKALRAFDIASHQKGDPYVWGATGPNAFDCSGLTSYAYGRAGVGLPRTSAAQAGAVRHIPHSRMRRGDLVFFSSGGHVYHVGLYLGRRGGEDYMLHAPHSGAVVRTEAIWTGDWFGGTIR